MPYVAETPRLWLQPMTVDEHFVDFWEMFNDEDAVKWTQHSPKTTREEALLFMLEVLPSAKNPNIDKFAILLRPVLENPEPWSNAKSKPKMIGLVGTNRMSDQGLETGYFLNKKYWGMGYATEAFAAFLKLYWGLPERLNVKHLVAKVDPGNVPSEKIVVRIGARRGPVLKGALARAIDAGKRRDIQCWYLDRPGQVAEETKQEPD